MKRKKIGTQNGSNPEKTWIVLKLSVTSGILEETPWIYEIHTAAKERARALDIQDNGPGPAHCFIVMTRADFDKLVDA